MVNIETLENKVKKLNAELDHFRNIESNEKSINEMKECIEKMEEQVEICEELVDEFEPRIETLEKSEVIIKEDIKSVNDKISNLKEQTDNKINTLDGKIENIGGKLDETNNKINSIDVYNDSEIKKDLGEQKTQLKQASFDIKKLDKQKADKEHKHGIDDIEGLPAFLNNIKTTGPVAVGGYTKGVRSIVAGTGITIDETDPRHPIVNATGGGGSGDVVGPASSTDNAIARFDGATGKLLQDGLATVSDIGEISTPSNVVAAAFYTSADNGVAIEGSNTGQGRAFVYATGNDTNIDLELSGQGTGKVKVTDDLNVTGTTKIDTLTAEELVITDASKNLVSASVATYPSLTELTYLKGVTSSIQTQLNAFVNAMIYKGNWDASAGTFPGAGVAQIGWFYTVSVGGTVDSVVFNVGDRIVATTNNASTTVYSGNRTQLDATDAVTSVNGQTGNVTGLVQYTSNTADLNMGTYDVITDTLRANSSGGLLIESANGTDVGIFGAGNTANVEWYGAHNYSTATQDTIAIFTGAGKTLGSAATATYPSLTELAYVKGVTSAIQTQLNAKLGLSGGTVTGAIVLDENASLQLDGSLSADGKWSGTTITATAGYTQAFGDLVYLDPTDSRREACDANAASGADGDCRGLIGMVVVAGTDGTACTILLQGTIRADANFPTLTVGGPVFASETAGDVVTTAPATSGAVVRVLGSALTADSMYFNPSGDFIVNV